MKKVIIIFNPEKVRAKAELPKLKTWLVKNGCRVQSVPSADKKVNEKYDFAITLGGDGTMLKTSKMVTHQDIPVLGVNLGTLGFLAETDLGELYSLLPEILKGSCQIEDRMVLDVSIKQGKIIFKKQALNDVVINSGNTGRVITITAKLDNDLLTDYVGDGVIVATPTGSTAYSLAAHGPIVHPSLSLLIITPVCPHTLTQRPLIVSNKHVLSLRLNNKNAAEKPVISIDGQQKYHLNPSDEVLISRAEKPFKLIINPKRKYLDVLRTKLKWGERGWRGND